MLSKADIEKYFIAEKYRQRKINFRNSLGEFLLGGNWLSEM